MTDLPLRHHPTSADMEYNPYLETPHTLRLTARNMSRESSYSGAERMPRSMHRRSRTDLSASIDRATSSPRRVSHTSLEDINLGPIEARPVKQNLFGGFFQGGRQVDDASSVRSTRSQKRMTLPSSLRQITSANPFSFFTSKSEEQQQPMVPEPADDEFLNLDIDAALFPPGITAYSAEEAFANLRETAENVIRQLQAAYKLRTFALHESLVEKRMQKEELEESSSRFQNIKAQLDEMAARVAEQDRAMRDLAEDLRLERQKRHDEEEARRQLEPLPINRDKLDSSSQVRHSKQSILSSDSGFESGDESIAESTMSKRNDDTVSIPPQSSNTTAATTPSSLVSPPPLPRPSGTPSQLSPARAQQSPSRPSAYDRVMKGISSSGIGSLITTSRCSNCRGLSAADAWSVVNVLKEENKALKNRMSELECAVEECITLVGG